LAASFAADAASFATDWAAFTELCSSAISARLSCVPCDAMIACCSNPFCTAESSLGTKDEIFASTLPLLPFSRRPIHHLRAMSSSSSTSSSVLSIDEVNVCQASSDCFTSAKIDSFIDKGGQLRRYRANLMRAERETCANTSEVSTRSAVEEHWSK
jgi:hypothetical protein